MKTTFYIKFSFKIFLILIGITFLNFYITGLVKTNYTLSKEGANRNIPLNEEFYQIDKQNQKFTREYLLDDISTFEKTLENMYANSLDDNAEKLAYYKKLYSMYDDRLTSFYNNISKRLSTESENETFTQLVYGFKINRINIATNYSNPILDSEVRIIEYYKSLSQQTKTIYLDFIGKYSTFLDN